MQDLANLEMKELVDMLAKYMEEYYQLSHDLNNSKKFYTCYEKIKAIQEEIESRKK